VRLDFSFAGYFPIRIPLVQKDINIIQQCRLSSVFLAHDCGDLADADLEFLVVAGVSNSEGGKAQSG
jgi:hypothetical protein